MVRVPLPAVYYMKRLLYSNTSFQWTCRNEFLRGNLSRLLRVFACIVGLRMFKVREE